MTIVLLALGWGSAVAIYVTAEPEVIDPLTGNLLANKKYVHELRVMGGRGSVVAEEFMQWFGSLWRGQKLAGTVAVLTLGATLVFRFVAARPALWRSPPIDVDALGRRDEPRAPRPEEDAR